MVCHCLFFIKKKEPMIAGIVILIAHIKKDASTIPIILSENNPMKNIASEPLNPSSTSVVVGIIVINK